MGVAEAEGSRGLRRLAACFVLAVIAAACLVFWIGVPVGVLWGLSKATDSFAGHVVLGLILVPAAMAAFSPALFWLNGLYLRITGARRQDEAEGRGAGRRGTISGPLEPMLIVSLGVALVAITVWFFFFAEYPPPRVIGAR